MIDYPMEECIVCESLFRADGDLESCGQCGEYFCGKCDDYEHEIKCGVQQNQPIVENEK